MMSLQVLPSKQLLRHGRTAVGPTLVDSDIIRRRQFHKTSSPSNNGIFGAAGDYMNSLRVKAAESLWSSLSEQERAKLSEHEQRLPPPPKTKPVPVARKPVRVPPPTPQPSIEELVAKARMEEAERVSAKFEEEKTKLLAEAEEAAFRRAESDLLLKQQRQAAFDKWQADIDRERQAEEEAVTTTVESTPATANGATATEAADDHAILGPAVCDLGHKRIHVVPAIALRNIPVWEKQRFYRDERAASMAKDKAKSLHIGLPGVIGIYENKDGTLSILDGQHRIGMLRHLADIPDVDSKFDFSRILVEVYPEPEDAADTKSHANEIFKEINKAQPATLVDLPGVVDEEILSIINEAATNMKRRFNDMFKPSQKCRKPHINVDNLRNELFVSGVIDRNELNTAKSLEDWMIAQNDALAEKFRSDKEARKSVPKVALEKAIKFEFYLGLDSSWYYQ